MTWCNSPASPRSPRGAPRWPSPWHAASSLSPAVSPRTAAKGVTLWRHAASGVGLGQRGGRLLKAPIRVIPCCKTVTTTLPPLQCSHKSGAVGSGLASRAQNCPLFDWARRGCRAITCFVPSEQRGPHVCLGTLSSPPRNARGTRSQKLLQRSPGHIMKEYLESTIQGDACATNRCVRILSKIWNWII